MKVLIGIGWEQAETWGWERQLWKLWGPETGQRQRETVPGSRPATYPPVCTWYPSAEARVSRVDRFHFHSGLTDNRQDQTFPSDFIADVWRLSHLGYNEGQAQENRGKWENIGWRIRSVTFPLTFPQDWRTAQETVICQIPKQNKTGLLVILTNGHSCRKVSTWNLSVLTGLFAVLWSLFQDSFFRQCFFMLTICCVLQAPLRSMRSWGCCFLAGF